MVFVTLLTLLSLLFALIEMEWKWSSGGNGLVHAILGIIVIVCSCINVITESKKNPIQTSKYNQTIIYKNSQSWEL